MNAHEMPFGAEYRGDGRTRFSLWAPAASRVDLVVEGAGERPMEARAEGFFTLETDATPATRYRYRIDGGQAVPDPASRAQAGDAHGPSVVVDPAAFAWSGEEWTGRPWEETVLYELHPGAFSPQGSFTGIEARLEYLAGLGVTAVELMPISQFPGERNWGYDGVLPFAPASAYGAPEELKRLVDSAHARGLMVFLDVVYNHFGPEGNYLHLYAPQFFTEARQTPWGAAIDFSRPQVREFFIHNALYWLEEYHIDGLRLDAVHAIADDSPTHFLTELAGRVRGGFGGGRRVHLVLENDDNEARYLRGSYAAQWDDDLHHALHVAATGEEHGYYADYARDTVRKLGRGLAEGFIYQGQPSEFRGGERRGEASADLSPDAFVAFVQNHDQVGNRAFGERIGVLATPEAVEALAAIYLLCPHIPMLFMGEEFDSTSPFLFFCDFDEELAPLVADGRRREFAAFPEFSDPAARERIPDPNSLSTFERSKLDWESRDEGRIELYRRLLEVRRREITPRIPGAPGGVSSYATVGERGLVVRWELGDGSTLVLRANLGDEPESGFGESAGRLLWGEGHGVQLPGRAVEYRLEER